MNTETMAAITQYCRYQERCHSEVRHKLLTLGSRGLELEQQMAELISTGLLDEERYAIAFAGGKFRMLHWGKVKIMHELKAKQISPYVMRKALDQITEEDYLKTLQTLIEKKHKELKSKKHPQQVKQALIRYLAQKGYEQKIISQLLNIE